MKKEFICILCPRGCHVFIDDTGKITGNFCARGVKYVETEMNEPKRTLTSTVRTIFEEMPRVSVKTSTPIPKDKIFAVMDLLNDVLIDRPMNIGDKVLENILGTGVDIVLTRSIMK